MSGKIKSEVLLTSMKKAINLGLLELKLTDINTNEKIPLDYLSISIIGSLGEELTYSHGGFANRVTKDDSSLAINFLINDKKFLNFQVLPTDLIPIYSEIGLYEYLVSNIVGNIPLIEEEYFSLRPENIGNLYFVDKGVNKYIQKDTNYSKIPERLKRSFEDLSYYINNINKYIDNLPMVYNSFIEVSNDLRYEFFLDSNGSEIVQYFTDFKILISIDFLNMNNSEINCNIVKRYKSIDDLEKNFFKKIKKDIVEEIQKRKKYFEIKSGIYPVLLRPSASNVFFHEALAAHLLSANYIVDGYSTIFLDRLYDSFDGLKGINIYMDPNIEEAYGSFKYDAEGVKSEKVNLIEDGKVVNYLSDSISAAELQMKEFDELILKQLLNSKFNTKDILEKYIDKEYFFINHDTDYEKFKYFLSKALLKDFILNAEDVEEKYDWRSDLTRLNAKSNGHARIEKWTNFNGFQSIISDVEARMSNLVVESNFDTSFDLKDEMKELCDKSGYEYYLEVEAHAGNVDPKTGLFVIEPNFIELVSVKDGSRKSINPGTFSLQLEDFIKNIFLVGNKNQYNVGICGASSGWVPVSSYTPYMIANNIPYQSANKLEQADESIFKYISFKNKDI